MQGYYITLPTAIGLLFQQKPIQLPVSEAALKVFFRIYSFMKFRKISNWQNPDELAGLLFFAQRIDEMTFAYTIDSYKTPTTSIPSLLTECLETIENYAKVGKDHSASLHILEELSLRLRGDKAVANCITLKLDTHLSINKNNAEELKSKLSVLRRELSPPAYLAALTPLLKNAIIDNKKKLIDRYSRELISTLQAVGLSAEHINKSVRKHFFSRTEIKLTCPPKLPSF